MGGSYGRGFIRLKYRIAWKIGVAVSFLLYFSGIVPLYVYVFRRLLNRHVMTVLMYHRVSDSSEEPDLTVSQKNFEVQVAYLKKKYDVVSLDKVVDIYKSGMNLKRDAVAITFDDGYRDNFTDAFPVLVRQGLPAAVFVATASIGRGNKLDKDDIGVMQKNNITFGAHTVNHRVLAELNAEEAAEEIKGSKDALEDILGEDVRFFAYPYGKKGRDFMDESMGIVGDSGFLAAFATDNGFITGESDIFALKRIGMRNFPLFVLKARMSGIFENSLICSLRRLFRI